MKFGQLIIRKIVKIVTTRCHILRLKCTKIDFGWGAPPNHLAGIKETYFYGKRKVPGGQGEERQGKEGKRRGGEEKRGERRGGEVERKGVEDTPHVSLNFL